MVVADIDTGETILIHLGHVVTDKKEITRRRLEQRRMRRARARTHERTHARTRTQPSKLFSIGSSQ